ncbi:MAG: hypothetical protein JSR09_00870 [Bacteroidetes bacterium]|nr:hypothetical protein [Bacteroidota bacterium]MBS1648231.1 hypothetical protein [Bacteroidota bacterium]
MNFLFQYLITFCFSVIHPFYVSVIDINHNAKEKILEISVRIFTDDLETALRNENRTTVDLAKTTYKAKNDKLIALYIKNKLQLNVDGKLVQLNYLGYEIQQESAWSYFEVTNISSFKKLAVNCSLLYEWQTQQMNILHVTENKIEKSFKLDNPKTQAVFDF